VAVCLVAGGSLHSASADVEIGQRENGFSLADERYLIAYEKAHKAGFDVGANLLASAWSDAEAVSDRRIRASTERLERWLNPPEPVMSSFSTAETPETSSTYPVTTASSSGCSYPGVEDESGGSYSVVNPTSGAYGCYQVIPSTWEAHCSDLGRDPAGQDACAARICAAQGSGAWAASGANPC
jgi:hypothetical protein